MRGGTGSYVPRGYSIIELQYARPIKQRPESDVRYCARCDTRLARDNYGALCSPCATKAEEIERR